MSKDTEKDQGTATEADWKLRFGAQSDEVARLLEAKQAGNVKIHEDAKMTVSVRVGEKGLSGLRFEHDGRVTRHAKMLDPGQSLAFNLDTLATETFYFLEGKPNPHAPQFDLTNLVQIAN